jgi:hypothetical protein
MDRVAGGVSPVSALRCMRSSGAKERRLSGKSRFGKAAAPSGCSVAARSRLACAPTPACGSANVAQALLPTARAATARTRAKKPPGNVRWQSIGNAAGKFEMRHGIVAVIVLETIAV